MNETMISGGIVCFVAGVMNTALGGSEWMWVMYGPLAFSAIFIGILPLEFLEENKK